MALIIGSAGADARAAAAPGAPPPAAPAGALPMLKPDAESLARLEKELKNLQSGTKEQKQDAEDWLFNSPPALFPEIEAAVKRPALDASTKLTLNRLITRMRPYAKVRMAREQHELEQQEWEAKIALQAFDEYGEHDPSWDDKGEEAIKLATSRFRNDRINASHMLIPLYSMKGMDDPLLLGYLARGAMIEGDGLRSDLERGGRYTSAITACVKAGPKFEKSKYPAHLQVDAMSFGVHAVMITTGQGDPNFRRMAEVWSRKCMELWPKAVSYPGMKEGYASELAEQVVQTQIDLGLMDRGAAVDKMLPAYLAAFPKRPSPLTFKGRMYLKWAEADMHGQTIDKLDPADRKQALDHLAVAEKAFTAAADLDPTVHAAPSFMILVSNFQGRPRDVMEKWFKRATAADPESSAGYLFKMGYFGSRNDIASLAAYAHECVQSRNWRGEVMDIGVKSHMQAAKKSKDEVAYYHQPAVWKDIEQVVIPAARINASPGSTRNETRVAYWAWRCGQWKIADEWFTRVGNKADPNMFYGDVRAMEAARQECAHKK